MKFVQRVCTNVITQIRTYVRTYVQIGTNTLKRDKSTLNLAVTSNIIYESLMLLCIISMLL